MKKRVIDNITRDIIERWRKNYIHILSQICEVKPEYIQKLKDISFDHCEFEDGQIVKNRLLKYTYFYNICYFDLKNNTLVYLDSMSKPIFVYISP